MPTGLLFSEADEQWELTRLYEDLAAVKDKIETNKRYGLTEGEKTRLRGLLLRHSPAEIAEQEYTAIKTVEVALSQYLYRYVEALTGRDRNALENWRDIETWLTAAGYRRSRVAINWEKMPDVPVLYGRQVELNQLKQWVIEDNACRVVSINGPAGIGKTSLVITLSKGLQSKFDGVIWQSLRHRPTCEAVLDQWLTQLPQQAVGNPVANPITSPIDSVMGYFREHRCLIVIDNLESILRSGSLVGGYEPGYEDYAELLKRLSEEPHQSCVVVTSRERNAETRGFAAATSPVKDLTLTGLSYEAAEQVLTGEGLTDALPVKARWKMLIEQYRGNPLILKIVSMTIQELFDGDVAHFLKQRKTLFGNVEYLIAQQCDRLSPEEQDILIQLAQQAEPIKIDQLEQPHSLQAITALMRRSLIEKSDAGFTLRPVVMEYARRYLL